MITNTTLFIKKLYSINITIGLKNKYIVTVLENHNVGFRKQFF